MSSSTLVLTVADATQLCTTLRSLSSSIRDKVSKRLAAQLQASDDLTVRSLDKSGSEIQAEALQVALLMQGLPADEASRTAALDALRRHDADPAVASFLQYWGTLGLMAGVYAPGAGHEVQTAFVDWYRGPPGQARYMPSLSALRTDLDRFVLQGWAPSAPPIHRDKLTTALGSCFADEIRIWLRAKGYRVNDDFRSGKSYPYLEDSAVPILQCSAGLVNTFVLRQQFEWALEGKHFDDDLWRGAKGSIALPTEAARVKTREMFEGTSLFVITLGLAEVWYRRRQSPTAVAGTTGGADPLDGSDVMWRAVPSNLYDPERHGFRVTTVAENLANLREIVRLVRTHAPAASIVFTLSPVPLAATFRGVSCVTANAASKAILRVAVDELMREHGIGGHGGGVGGHGGSGSGHGGGSHGGGGSGGGGGDAPSDVSDGSGRAASSNSRGPSTVDRDAHGGLFYWPAYEMIKEGFRDPYLDDGRHPKPEVVQQILQLFGKYYLPSEEPPATHAATSASQAGANGRAASAAGADVDTAPSESRSAESVASLLAAAAPPPAPL